MSNQPPFDPLYPTRGESDDMLAGYLAAFGRTPKPELASMAFEHGWRMGRNDKAGVVDGDQRELARRLTSPPSQPDPAGSSEGER